MSKSKICIQKSIFIKLAHFLYSQNFSRKEIIYKKMHKFPFDIPFDKINTE